MPSNQMNEFSRHRMSDSDRSGSFDSQGSRSRSRSSTFDDENLKYLTSEEKNALLFFEETIDAFEDDIEDPSLSRGTHFVYSARSTDDSQSETEDIIDLVQSSFNIILICLIDSGIGSGSDDQKPTQKDAEVPQSITSVSSPMTIPAKAVQINNEAYSPDLPGENRKFLGAVPTPVIIAQKISEKNADNGKFSPLSPRESKPVDVKKSVGTSPISEGHFIFPSSASTKVGRFPTNINIKPVGKQYNKTIAKAAVNVHERKAQMLANLHGPTFYADEIDGKLTREQLSRNRSTSFRDAANEQTRYEALTKLGLVKEMPIQAEIPSPVCTSPISNAPNSPKFLAPESTRRQSGDQESISNILKSDPSPFIPLGKTVVFKGEARSTEINKRHSSPQTLPEQKQLNLQEVKRTFSLPRPPAFRSQGITVQFSGRDSSDESRKDALRRLGLLKEL
ncbi:proline and serine-rich protein 2 [Pelodytes ibericus]